MWTPPTSDEVKLLDKSELAGLKIAQDFAILGSGYSREHSTRPSTIGLVLSSSPIALLAWVGEKYLEWSDENPSLDTILEAISLYWFTDTSPSSIFSYRGIFVEGGKPGDAEDPAYFINKPMGFSCFPKEILPLPELFAKETGNLVFYNKHENGGHFAAIEEPKLLMQDMEDFLKVVWKKE